MPVFSTTHLRAAVANTRQDNYPLPPSSRMWALNKPEVGYIVFGVVGAIVSRPSEAYLIPTSMLYRCCYSYRA